MTGPEVAEPGRSHADAAFPRWHQKPLDDQADPFQTDGVNGRELVLRRLPARLAAPTGNPAVIASLPTQSARTGRTESVAGCVRATEGFQA